MPSKTGPQVLVDVSQGTMPASDMYDWPTLVRLMRKDPTIQLVYTLANAPILASGWSIEQDETTNIPDDIYKFIERLVHKHRLHYLRHVCDGTVDFGWQGFEKVFDTNGEVWELRKLKPLVHDYTEIMVNKKDGDFLGFKQTNPYGSDLGNLNGTQIKLENALLTSYNVYGTDWRGRSVMRLLEGQYTRELGTWSAADRFENKVAGAHWVLNYPTGTTPINGVEKDNSEIADEILKALSANAKIALPNDTQQVLDELTGGQLQGQPAWKLELISASGEGMAGFTSKQEYYDKLKARAFGLPERSVFEGQFGTKAEAGEHIDFALVGIADRHQQYVDPFNKHVINQLLRFNWGEEYEDMIYVKPAPITDDQKAFFRELYMQLLSTPEGMGVELTTIDIDALRDKLEIPVSTENVAEELLEGMRERKLNPPAPPPGFGQGNTNQDEDEENPNADVEE